MLAPGQSLGGYRLVEALGSDLASLWSARAPNGDTVALRARRIPRDHEDRLRTQVAKELDVACRAQHPNLLPTLDAGIDEGWHYVVLEAVQGLLLESMIPSATSPVSPGLSGYIAHQIARALAYVHDLTDASGAKLGHLRTELSPSSIVLEATGRVRLAQMVTAESRQDLLDTAGQEVHSQVAYLSPEVVTQSGQDARSDVFSLGVILWELLAGERLFQRDSDLETLKAVQEATIPSMREGLPAELVSVVQKCLAKAPAERFASMTALVEALEESLRGIADVGLRSAAEHVASVTASKFPKRRTAMLSQGSQAPKPSTDPLSTASAPPVLDDPFYDPVRDEAIPHPRFEVLGRLGSGGMGEVYRVKDHELDEVVALKRIPRNSGHEGQFLERLKREVRFARRIASEHVCRIFDIVDLGGGDRGLTMSLIDGVTLADIMKMGVSVSYSRFARWAADVADGLAAAHTLNIIHRDLKPENIMIRNEDDRAVILDFGIARSQQDNEEGGVKLTQAGIIMGTPLYMSPEQLSNRDLDGRSDLYSLGLIMAELITGEVPFSGKNYSEILEKRVIRGGQYRLQDVHPGAPPLIAQVLDRLLEPAAEDRPADARLVKNTFEKFIVEPETSEPAVADTALVMIPSSTPTLNEPEPLVSEAVPVSELPAAPAPPVQEGAKSPRFWIISAVVLTIMAAVLVGVLLKNGSKRGTGGTEVTVDAGMAVVPASSPDAGVPDTGVTDSGVSSVPDAGVKRRRRPPPPAKPIEF